MCNCISPLIDIIKCNITYWKTMMCRETSCCAACVLYRYIYILYSVTYFETNFICKYQSHDRHVTRWLHPPTTLNRREFIYQLLNLYPVIWELSFVLQALIRKIMWKFSFPTDWISERTNKTQMLHRVVFTFSNKFILWNCWIKLIPVATVILIKHHSPERYDENGNVLRMVIETITNICLDNSDVRLSCIVDWTYLWANAH